MFILPQFWEKHKARRMDQHILQGNLKALISDMEKRLKFLQNVFQKIQDHVQRRKLGNAVAMDEINQVKRTTYMQENINSLLDFG